MTPERTAALFAEMARLSPLPLLAVDSDTGAIIAFNQLARDTLGLQSEQPGLRELFDNPSLARQFLLIARNNGFIRQFEARIRLSGGQRVWVLLAARLCEIDGASILLVTTTDIHERRLQEEALRESELRHRRVLETANEGYALFDAGMNELLDVNPALCDLLMYHRDALLALRAEQLVTEDSLAALHALRDRWHNLPNQKVELGLRRANGERIAVEVSISALSDQEGRVTSVFALISDITARKLSEERVLYLAFYDTLTALPNRFLFAEHVEQALKQRARHGRQLALMFIDLDDFKRVNDTLGHDAGDELLRTVGKRLSNCVRATDTVSRQGGDEFMVLLANLQQGSDAIAVAEKMLGALAQPVEIGTHQVSVQASIGIALCPEHGESLHTLRRHADIAMYQAKFGGKHRYAVYSAEAHHHEDTATP
ncbi:diguanylate cyclase domain-containing protein [Chitinimonas sp. BJYL2]|uniref:diguanylate cyclase domain-containing protein n=1 Tax=Chitinimonas sp. BJYL2 TaxID=2976696 RepID=UPI0022B5A29E|nr:diguanylate cyclase [Chitinimonas sp. BJYL2]